MKPDPKMLDDIARVAGGAVNILSGLQQQVRDDMKIRIEDMAARLDLVPREDFDQALAMIAALRKRVDALEAAQTKKTATGPKTKTKKKPKKR